MRPIHRKKKRVTWEITAQPREAPEEVKRFIMKLCLLQNDEITSRLNLFLQQIDSSATLPDPDPSHLGLLAQRCLSAEANIAEHSFSFMKSLLMFTLCLEQYVLLLQMNYMDLTLS